jgi:hypothetical protein
MSRLSGSISAAGALLNRGEELAGAAAAAGGAIEERVAALLGACAGVEARVMGLERLQATLQQVCDLSWLVTLESCEACGDGMLSWFAA